MKNPEHRTSLPRWGAENVARLGTEADYLIAEILRVPTAEVRAQRESRGIPKLDGRHGIKHSWTPGDLGLLGTMADAARSPLEPPLPLGLKVAKKTRSAVDGVLKKEESKRGGAEFAERTAET
ncbi:MAG: hypothetical protein H8M99_03220 [Gloeobacteraceae cyanobacterium ES-bin-144]|nr:hypothetical protein [Verrucomicrobiales bacterium]